MKKKFLVLILSMLIVVVFAAVVVAVPREEPTPPIVSDNILASPRFQIILRGVENGVAVRQRISATVPRLGRDYRYQWWIKTPDTATWKMRRNFSTSRFLSLRNLIPGEYNVKVYARNRQTNKVTTAQTRFTVDEPVFSIPRPVIPQPGIPSVPTSVRLTVVIPAGTEYKATIEGQKVTVTLDKDIAIPLTIKLGDSGFVIQPVN